MTVATRRFLSKLMQPVDNFHLLYLLYSKGSLPLYFLFILVLQHGINQILVTWTSFQL